VRRVGGVAAVVGLLVAGCGNAGHSGPGSLRGSITVAAASSLTDAFTKIAAGFRERHPGAKVALDLDASSALALRIRHGAPADVFASADEVSMRRLVDEDLVRGTPTVFARNRLEIVVKKGNPSHVRTLADLARVGTVSLCVETAPCGTLAAEALRMAGVTIPEGRTTRAPNARAALTAVAPGDADAGIVYATDVLAARGSASGVPIPDAQNVLAVYPVASLKGSKHPALAKEFADYVSSPDAERTLRRLGFVAP